MTEPNELSDGDLDKVSGGTAIAHPGSPTAPPKPSTTTSGGGGGGTAPPTPTTGGDKSNIPSAPDPIVKGFGIS